MPVLPGLGGGADRLLDLGRAALVDVGEDVRLVVRHDRLEGVARADLLAADDEEGCRAAPPSSPPSGPRARRAPASPARSRGRARCGRRRAEDSWAAHGGGFYDSQHGRAIPYPADGGAWGSWCFADGARRLARAAPAGGDDAAGDHPLAGRLRGYFARRARTTSRTSSSSSSGARPSSVRAVEAMRSIPYGETATYGEVAALAGHPNAQRAVGLGLRARTASRSSCPATAWSARTASARTARSARSTSDGCWSSKVSFSEDVRIELAAIAPERECDRLAELSALFHFAGRLHLLGRGEVSLHLDLASAAVGEARVHAPALVRRRAPRSAPTGGGPSGGRRATSSTSTAAPGRSSSCARRRRRRAARAAGPAAAAVVARACCRAAYLRGALLAAGSVTAPPSPHLEVRSESRAGAEAVAAAAAARGRGAARRGRGATSRLPTQRGSTGSPASWPPPGASDAALALQERAVVGSTKRAGEPARERRPREPRPLRTRRARPARSRPPAPARGAAGRAPPATCGRSRELRLGHPSLSLRELAAKCDPPASKAAAHRRLRSLLRIAQR